MKIGNIFLVLAVLLSFYSFSYAQQESLTITTYYPSPVGTYSELQLFPKAGPGASTCTAPNDEGKMYYDSVTHSLKVCQDVSGTIGWQDVGAGGSNYWTQNGTLLYANNNNWSVGIGDDTPIGRLQIAGDEVRIGSSGGGVGVANGDGDLYVQNDLEVDGTGYINTLNTDTANISTTANINLANITLANIGWEHQDKTCNNTTSCDMQCSGTNLALGGGCDADGKALTYCGPSTAPANHNTWYCKTAVNANIKVRIICARVT